MPPCFGHTRALDQGGPAWWGLNPWKENVFRDPPARFPETFPFTTQRPHVLEELPSCALVRAGWEPGGALPSPQRSVTDRPPLPRLSEDEAGESGRGPATVSAAPSVGPCWLSPCRPCYPQGLTPGNVPARGLTRCPGWHSPVGRASSRVVRARSWRVRGSSQSCPSYEK